MDDVIVLRQLNQVQGDLHKTELDNRKKKKKITSRFDVIFVCFGPEHVMSKLNLAV